MKKLLFDRSRSIKLGRWIITILETSLFSLSKSIFLDLPTLLYCGSGHLRFLAMFCLLSSLWWQITSQHFG
jgi:hypothetical protein